MDERIKLLQVNVSGQPSGQLLQQSGFEYRYLGADPVQPVVGLLMLPTRLTWHDGALFPVMDQNLPEGDLFNRLRQQFPKQAMTTMRLLALIGDNGIGRLGYRMPGSPERAPAAPITRQTLLRMPFTPQVFDDLVSAYLATGIRLAPMFDVVTACIYRYQRAPGGPEPADHTLALRMWSGKAQRSKAYPLPEEPCRFGRDVCGVRDPQASLNRIAEAMVDTLHAAASDPRIPAALLAQLRPVWEAGVRHGQ